MVRAVFETNVFGVIAVTNAMLPLLRRSSAARVVNVSSGVVDPHEQPGRTVRGPAPLGRLFVAQGAAALVRLATLDADGPTAGFFSQDGPVPW